MNRYLLLSDKEFTSILFLKIKFCTANFFIIYFSNYDLIDQILSLSSLANFRITLL